MLYLMMDKSDKEYLVKVGFSDREVKLRNRRKAYYSYNPRAIMRSTFWTGVGCFLVLFSLFSCLRFY